MASETDADNGASSAKMEAAVTAGNLAAAAVLAQIVVSTLATFGLVHAEEMATFVLEMNDGVLTPERIEIPANTQVKIILRNTGSTPAEFESLRLRKEKKVLGPGVESFIVIRRASPEEYPFFDEFHLETGQGVVVAR
ncbi:MAG: cupredoxin domain-containing protein [Sneathiella sp.]|nr:cupredoxin domain-containing protein [Sneathiella sp.]